MTHTEIIAVYSEIHTKYMYALRGQHVDFSNIRPGGTQKNIMTFGRLN